MLMPENANKFKLLKFFVFWWLLFFSLYNEYKSSLRTGVLAFSTHHAAIEVIYKNRCASSGTAFQIPRPINAAEINRRKDDYNELEKNYFVINRRIVLKIYHSQHFHPEFFNANQQMITNIIEYRTKMKLQTLF